MRILLLVLVTLSLIAPAVAQGHKMPSTRPSADPAAEARKRQDAEELDRAYKSALDRVTPTEKPDPWGNVRNADTGKTKKK